MALPDKDHWLLRDAELHRIGPRYTVPDVNALYALDVGAGDLGQTALVLSPRSWWIVNLGSGEGERWARLSNEPFPDDEPPVSVQPFEHTQTTAALEWDVVHGLGRYAPVVVMDDAREAVIARVVYVDRNRVRVIFATPRTGHLSIG